MTDPTSSSAADGITAAGLGAVIPTALLVALLSRQSALPSDPVMVDARGLAIAIPPDAIASLLRTLYPDRPVSVSFAKDAILVSVPGLPAVQVEIPADGLRVHVDERGFRLGER